MKIVINGETAEIPSAREVYDGQERVIGAWFGKPLYRKCFRRTTPQVETVGWIIDVSELDIDEVCEIRGIIKGVGEEGHSFVSGNQYFSSSNYCCLWHDNGKIGAKVAFSSHANVPISVVLEYTKTTDPAAEEA